MVPTIVCFVIRPTATVPPRRRRGAAPCPIVDDDTLRKVAECGSRTGLATALKHLCDAGWMRAGVVDTLVSNTRHRLSHATMNHGDAQTPYGPVLRMMPLPLEQLPRWSFVHPQSLLYYFSTISQTFGDIMAKSVTPGVPVKIVLYVDEICPGNPLRPEKARTLQAIYWCIADWPQWLLQRTAAWPCFGTIRSSLVKKLPGGIAHLMRLVLLQFFPEEGHSFTRGLTIYVRNTPLVVTGEFGGFLADEKAHKELSSLTGASGTKACISCQNVFNRVKAADLAPGCVSTSCTDPSLFVRHTNATLYAAYDYIGDNLDQQTLLQQCLGVKYDPHGLMHDPYIRTFYKPVDHQLRDWQHTMVSGGVANVECGRLLGCLIANGIALTTVQNYLATFVLPTAHGKVDTTWLSPKRLGKKRLMLSSFSSVMLSIVPILFAFVTDIVPHGHPLQANVACIGKLYHIISVLRLGPDGAMPYIDVLRRLVREHAVLQMQVYPGSAKPKFHHLFHVADGMEFVGKLLSCFVTERKHRSTKRCALFVFRHIDNTVVREMLSRQCEAIRSGSASLFCERFLDKPKSVSFGGATLCKSVAAVLPCGTVHADDLIWLKSADVTCVGSVVCFWSDPACTHINVQVYAYTRLDEHGVLWASQARSVSFFDSDCVVDTCIYARLSGDRVRAIVPAIAYL